MKRRILAGFLALVMVLGMMPMQIFANETEDYTEPVIVETEAVVETTAPAETEAIVVNTAPVETEAAPEPETTAATEEVTEATTEATTESTEEATEEATEPEDIPTVVDLLDVTPADDAVVYVTGANAGVLVKASDGKPMVNREVTVKDLNSDGVLTYDEALVAAHAAYCPDGYDTAEDEYLGTSVTKLWGVEAGYNYYFFNNQKALTMNVGNTASSTVKTGDKLYATIFKDTTTCADVFSWFDAEEKTVTAGQEFTLTLKGFAPMDQVDNTTPKALSGISVGTWNDGAFTALEGKTTGTDGTVTLSFDKAGTYYVTASGTVDGITVTDFSTRETKVVSGTTMAPYCVVTVEGDVEPETPASLSALKFTASTKDQYELNLSPAFDPAVAEYTLYVPDAIQTFYAWATLGEGVEGDITACYTTTNNAEKAISITSGHTSGTAVTQCIPANSLAGGSFTVKIGENEVYTITVARVPSLKSLTLKLADGTAVTLDTKYYSCTTEYNAFIPADAQVTVTTGAKVNGATVTINGGTETTLPPVWDNHTWDIVIKASAEGLTDGVYTVHLHENVQSISVNTPPTKTQYNTGDTFDVTGMTLLATYANSDTKILTADDFTYTPTTALDGSVKTITASYNGLTVEQAIEVGAPFTGSGTEEAPYLLNNAADLQKLSELVQSGVSFAGMYFKITDNIELPATTGENPWVPLGVDKNTPFSGYIDGGNYLLTVPKGGLPLIGCPVGAKLSNLNIIGEQIESCGVVHSYVVGATIDIDHVTLKSGTKTLKSGFIGGYASGTNSVNITNCTVESGVVIGYDKSQNNIGSFGGDFNGTISNCVSYATVYGVNFVGGIVGDKGQSMGTFVVENSKFYGNVVATGNYVGGICGHGYGGTSWGINSAPNTAMVTIKNCECSGNVTGADYVGGILGGETGLAQCWANGAGSITDNAFTGTITANGTYVGGVIGYMRSLNLYTTISGNTYVGNYKGIGGVQYVDTNCETHETESGALYFNTETSTADCPTVQFCSWQKAHNRTDDPLGADADKLCKKIGSEEPEEPAKHYLSGLEFGPSDKDLNVFTLEEGKWDYDFAYPNSEIYSPKIKATLSEDAPEGSTITAWSLNYSGVEASYELTSGEEKYASYVGGGNMKSAWIKLVVGVEGDTQTYMLNVSRTLTVTVSDLTDSSSGSVVYYNDVYWPDESQTRVKFKVTSSGSDARYVGEEKVVGQYGYADMAWDDNDTFQVTVKAVYEDQTAQQVLTFKKYQDTMTFQGSCGENVNWKLDGGVLTISGTGAMADYSTSNYAPWYTFRTKVTRAVVEEGVTSVGAYAFYGCSMMTSVTFPGKSLTTLGNCSFWGSAITEIEVPETVTEIGYNAFYKCGQLTTATVYDVMGSGMFSGCGKLSTVNFKGTNLEEIPYHAFTNCGSLKTLVLPEGVKSFGDQEINRDYVYFENITIPNTLTGISAAKFGDYLTSITVKDDNPNYVKEGKILYTKDGKELVLAEKDFEGSVTVKEGVTTIGERAFKLVKGLTSISMPNTVETIGDYAFSQCSNLTDATLGTGVKSIGKEGFYKCTSLKAITLPDTLETVGEAFLSGCTTIERVEIPGKVTKFPPRILASMTSLKEVVLPAGLVSMDYNVFYGYTGSSIYFRGDVDAWNAITGRGKPADGAYEIVYNYGRTDVATIVTQPADRLLILGDSGTTSVTIAKPEGVTVNFAWYASATKSTSAGTAVTEGVTLSDDGLTSTISPSTAEVGTKYYYCIITTTLADGTTVKGVTRPAQVDVSEKMWEGEGSETNPFLLKTADDLQKLSDFVNAGNSCSGKYFKVTTNITLPTNWKPIGCTVDGSNYVNAEKAPDNLHAFSGTIDGKIDDTTNATIIVPAGEKPLIGFVLDAFVRNLNIKGEQIEGAGLVNNYTGVGYSGNAVTIENVRVLSGTKTLESGLVASVGGNGFAHASASFVVTIRNCVVEEGVTIGYTGTENGIGSFAGQINGTVENCVSYATVQGNRSIGGIISGRDNAMSQCVVKNSQFHGTVTGTVYVGGIVAEGYGNATAPNGACPTITGCTVTGTVKGTERVGGIFGGDGYVAQTWSNVVGSISDNTFTGKIEGEKYVGAIIGYRNSLNKYDTVSGNTYSADCGASLGIGYVKYLDTSCEDPATFEGTVVFNTGNGTADCPTVEGCGWQPNHNRTDDPLGADADKLCKKIGSTKAPALELMVNNSWMADKQNPQKAELGEDGIFRIANRGSNASDYIWVSAEEGTTVDFTLLQGKTSTYFSNYQNQRENNNVYDGTTYQFYYNNSNTTLPLVAKFDLTGQGGGKATYYLIVDKGEIGSYTIGGSFTSESDLFTSDGITFTEAGQKLTLAVVPTTIGTGTEATTPTWKYTTSDNHVALVDSKTGEVTSVGGGTATITATSKMLTVTTTVTSTAPEHKIHTYGSDDKCTICGDRKPTAVKTTFTLVDKEGAYAKSGDTELYKAALTVSDLDCDGSITYIDLFNAAHAAFCAAGTDGFQTESSDYGPYITKFWGEETSNISYYANNKSVNAMTDKVSGNTHLAAFFYRDTENYYDLYTWFDKDSSKYVTGMAKTYTVHGANDQAPYGATVTVLDSTGAEVKSLSTTVGADGTFTITFPATGTYTIWVKGTASYNYWGKDVTGAPVVPCFQTVEVSEPKTAVLHITIVDDENNFVKTTDGEEVYRYAFTAMDDPENPDGKVTVLEALKQIHEQKCPAGAAGLYIDNGFIRYVWGVNTGGYLSYYFDDVWMQGYQATMTGTYDRQFVDKLLGTEINPNGQDDYCLYMFQTYGDVYTYFYPREQTAWSGVPQEFTVNGDKARKATTPVGASVTVTDSEGNVLPELATTTDENGKFIITFPAAGQYTIDVGNAAKQAYVHSRCFVTVRGVESTKQTLIAGQSTTLKICDSEGKVNKNVTWALNSEDTSYVTMTVKNGVATVKAQDVSEKHTVTIAAETNDTAMAAVLTILPKAQGIALNEQNVIIDLGGDVDETIFTATVLPADATQKVTWTSSNKKVATVENGKLTLTGTLGSAKITATTTDGSKLSASVTVNVVDLAQSIVLSGNNSIIGGKTATYTATEEDGTAIKASNITWSLDDTTYASVNTSGKVTTKAVPEKTTVTLTATIKNSERYVTEEITIVPAATYVDVLEDETVVTGKTLKCNVNNGKTALNLTAAVYPTDATQSVKWTTSNAKIATVDENGTVTYAGKTGTVTITATTTDGSNKRATMKITFSALSTKVEIAEHESTLRSGSKLTLSASTDLAKVGVNWSLANAADKSYVTLSGSKLTAKTVYEEHVVTLVATAKDGGATATTTVTIQPKSDNVLILKHGEVNVTKTTQSVNKGVAYTLTAANVAGTAQNVTWKTSNKKIVSLSATEGEEVTLNLLKAGTATITATAEDGSKTTVTIKVTTLVESLRITGSETVASGKSVTLKAVAEPTKAANKSVTWSVIDGANYATINSSGKLTANKNLMTKQTVTVQATAKDGSGATAEMTVTILPVATSVVMQQKARTVDMQTMESLQLSAKVYPASASQAINWTSSSTKIATVDANGLVTFHKGGTVTITATAADGSNKKATVKLTVVKSVDSIELDDNFLAGGKSLNLAKLVQVGPSDASNKKVVWSMTGDTAYATLSSAGVLKAKTVTQPKTITVTATAADGYGAKTTATIEIYPATTKVAIQVDGETVTGTVKLAEGDSLQLSAVSLPLDAYQDWTWTSSKKAWAEVDETGCVTGLTAGKTVTITATAKDGTNKKATLKVKIVSE